MPNHAEPSDTDRKGPPVRSLWEPLHDAWLQCVVSDRLARQVTLELDIPHQREFEGLTEAVRWRLVVHDARILLAKSWQMWPGPPRSTRGISRDEETRLLGEFQKMGRDLSIDWEQFERTVAEEPICIMDATLTVHSDSQVLAIQAIGAEAGGSFAVEVTGRTVLFERSDIGDLPIENFVQSGAAYWTAFCRTVTRRRTLTGKWSRHSRAALRPSACGSFAALVVRRASMAALSLS